jgi:hypothetical protein
LKADVDVPTLCLPRHGAADRHLFTQGGPLCMHLDIAHCDPLAIRVFKG